MDEAEMISAMQIAVKDIGHNEWSNSKEISKIKATVAELAIAVKALQEDNKRLHDIIFKQMFPLINEHLAEER